MKIYLAGGIYHTTKIQTEKQTTPITNNSIKAALPYYKYFNNRSYAAIKEVFSYTF